MLDTFSAKKELRRLMRARRTEACWQNPDAPLMLRDRFLAGIEIPARAVVSGYAARDHEIDPLPLMEALHERGCDLCLPTILGKTEPLAFRTWIPGDRLIPGSAWSIPEPVSSAAVVEPAILLVPLLAFDSDGNRLGNGGGYYDRTLADLRRRKKIIAIGVAFSCQQVDEVPAGYLDEKLDKIATELDVLSILISC